MKDWEAAGARLKKTDKERKEVKERERAMWNVEGGDWRWALQPWSWVHTGYKLLMWALNKWVQCTGRGRWIAQCESQKVTSKIGLIPSERRRQTAQTHQQNQWLLWVRLLARPSTLAQHANKMQLMNLYTSVKRVNEENSRNWLWVCKPCKASAIISATISNL